MGKTRNLNGIPGNLALSYLSQLGYHNGGYMADWVNYIAHDKMIDVIEIDILNSKIEPLETDIQPLKSYLSKLREILKKELNSNGFELDFIKKAVLRFEIPIDNPRIKSTVFCYPFIEDCNGKIYKPKKRIIETAYEIDFNPVKKVQTTMEKVKNSWMIKLKEIFN